MGAEEGKRKAKRKDVRYEIKARFPDQENFTSLVAKDLSATGIRVVATRLLKIGDVLDIKMCVNGRDIQCQGKVAWFLLLSPCLGGISPFDVGMEFLQMNQDDKEFLEKLVS
jgi:hypothetical protein